MKDSDKLKLMLLAWNYHNQAQGKQNTHLIGRFCKMLDFHIHKMKIKFVTYTYTLISKFFHPTSFL